MKLRLVDYKNNIGYGDIINKRGWNGIINYLFFIVTVIIDYISAFIKIEHWFAFMFKIKL